MANKLYEEASVQAIADAIRLKNDGIADTYTIAEMNDAILDMPFANVPSYHYAEAGRVTKKILDLKALYPNHIVFGTISDNHPDLTKADVLTGARHCAFALESVGAMAQCDFIANLGDNLAGTNIDTDVNLADFMYMENATRYALGSMTSFNLVGNHCKSNSTQKIYDLIGKHNTFDNYGTTKIRGFGYKDFTDKKVRVIALNTCDYWNSQGGNGMSYEQKDFFMKSLDLSAKSDYADWTIVVLSHIPLDFLGGDYNKGADLKAILKAYCNGTTASITVNSSYANAQNESSKYSGTLSYNYAGKNAPRVINIHGHIHTNKYGKLKFIDDNTELDIMRVSTPNSAFNQNASTDRYTSYGDYSITTTEANKIKKVAGTKADTSATFYFIDLDGKTIYSIGYGADVDRTIPYKSGTFYKVTLNLTDVTASNIATSTSADEIYKNTLTPMNGYDLGDVTVTMGGVDITSSVYSNGIIKIDQSDGEGNIVTGDIVITASAKIEPWSYEVPDVAVAIRQNPEFGSGAITFTSSNSDAIVCVTTANDYGYTDRESNTVYLMPVPSEANTVIVDFTPEVATTARYVGYKKNGSTLTKVFESDRISDFTYVFAKGSIDYITITLRRTDGSSWAWGFNDALVGVTFTNGVSGESGGDEGGTDTPSTPTYTNIIDTVGTEDNIRLRSGGATAAATGFASNYFPVNAGDTIEVYFPNGNRASIPSNGVYCCVYSDTNGTLVAAYTTGQSQITNETDNGYTVKIPSSLSNVKYARVAGGANGQYADWVVTKNEPIV